MSIEDLNKMNPMFKVENINFFINVAVDRFQSNFDKTEKQKFKLSRELDKTKELIETIRKRQVITQSTLKKKTNYE